MKQWLKIFGLSFFSDKIAKESRKRSYFNFLLGFILALVFLFCGVIAASILPFKTHYNNSSDFKTVVHTAFANADADKRINISVKGGSVTSSKGGEDTKAQRTVDTFINEDDAIYKVNGYNLVVDTRSAGAYDDFEPYCISNDGTNEKITYEEYLSLSSVAKRNFDFKIRYTGKELELTAELTEKHINYLEKLSAESNKEIVESYADLKSKKANISESDYQKAAYALYIRAYYPDLSEYETSSYVPLLRNYYYNTYLTDDAEKFIIIFDDSCIASFKTDKGAEISFYGFYGKLNDGLIVESGASTSDAEAKADAFIHSAFLGNTSRTVYVYLLNMTFLCLIVLLIPVILALVVYSVFKMLGVEWCTRYGLCFKIVGSHVWFASFISALITFVCGYLVTGSNLLIFALGSFFLIMLIRSSIWLIKDVLILKKQRTVIVEEEPENSEEEQ